MGFGPVQMGKLLIFFGLMTVLAGGWLIILGRFGIFKLSGDLEFESKNWRIFLPITSCIVISIILTVILWVISFLRR